MERNMCQEKEMKRYVWHDGEMKKDIWQEERQGENSCEREG
jgi:hypothetical protein